MLENTQLSEKAKAILAEWDSEDEVKEIQLPSTHQIGDNVKVFLMPEGEETFPGFNARVIAVHFTVSKVKYDLELTFVGDVTTRVYNIDSVLVTKK